MKRAFSVSPVHEKHKYYAIQNMVLNQLTFHDILRYIVFIFKIENTANAFSDQQHMHMDLTYDS